MPSLPGWVGERKRGSGARAAANAMQRSCHEREHHFSQRLDDVRRQLRGARENVEPDGQSQAALCAGPPLADEATATLLLEIVAVFLDAEDVVRLQRTSSTWWRVLSSEAVWDDQCLQLWADKLWVPVQFHDRGMSRFQAYWASRADGERIEIAAQELCELRWTSRMKGCAGASWTYNDPWWQGDPAAERVYQADGTYTDAVRGEGTWRFADNGARATHGMVRMARGQHEFPSFHVSRYRWAWILQNCWCLNASFPLPCRGECAELEDGGEVCARVTVASSAEEALRFNAGLLLPPPDQANGAVMSSTEGDGGAGAIGGGLGGQPPMLGARGDGVGEGVSSASAPDELLASIARTWALFDQFDTAGRALQQGLPFIAARAVGEAGGGSDGGDGGNAVLAQREGDDAGEGEQEGEGGGWGASGRHGTRGAAAASSLPRSLLSDEELTSQHVLAQHP